MLISYKIEEVPPTAAREVSSREQLLSTLRAITDKYGLEMEPFTAWEEQDEKQERVQGVFLLTSTPAGPWCIGAFIRRNNGELRIWPRDNVTGPINGSTAIEVEHLDTSIEEMVEGFTRP